MRTTSVYMHKVLWNAAQKVYESDPADYKARVSAIVLLAPAAEAYINYLCWNINKKDFGAEGKGSPEMLSIKDKLKWLRNQINKVGTKFKYKEHIEFDVNFGATPLQEFLALFELRNSLVHPKFKPIQSQDTAGAEIDFNQLFPDKKPVEHYFEVVSETCEMFRGALRRACEKRQSVDIGLESYSAFGGSVIDSRSLYLQQERKGSRAGFEKVLSMVPDVEPEPHDRL